jgi:site-specific DNA recombinase
VDMPEVVAAYARISEDVLELEKGVRSQLRQIHDRCEQRGWVVGKDFEFIDNDISALRGDYRPGYEALLSAAKAGKFSRIVVFQMSRLWRNRAERATAIELLSKARVSITLVNGGDIDLQTPFGRSIAAQMGEPDTLESELKAERVRAAAYDRAQAGIANGHVAYGWRRINEYGKYGKRVSFTDVIEPEQAVIVQEIVNRLLARESLNKIVADLNRRGVAPPRSARDSSESGEPRRWRTSSVRKIALRPANAGLRVYHRNREDEVLLPVAWAPIISHDQYEQVTALLTDPTRVTTKGGARVHAFTFAPEIARCGKCKSYLRVVKRAGHEMYVCGGPGGCTGRRKAWVDDLVERVVERRLQQPDARELFRRDDSSAKAAREEIARIEGKLLLLSDDFDTDKITRAQFHRSTARHRARLAELEKDAAKVVEGLPPDMISELIGPHAKKRLRDLAPSQRRALLASMGFDLELAHGMRGGAGFRPESVKIHFIKDDDLPARTPSRQR